MEIFQIALILATFLCSLVAGFLFAFALVAMPGIGHLNDREFLRAFQVMDRIIQNNQPVFMLVWTGSVVTLVISTVPGFCPTNNTSIQTLKSAAVPRNNLKLFSNYALATDCKRPQPLKSNYIFSSPSNRNSGTDSC